MTYTQEQFVEDIQVLLTPESDTVTDRITSALATSAIDGNNFLSLYTTVLPQQLFARIEKLTTVPEFYIKVTDAQIQEYREKSMERFNTTMAAPVYARLEQQTAQVTPGSEEHTKLLDKRKYIDDVINQARAAIMREMPETTKPGKLMQPYAIKVMGRFVRAAALAPDAAIPKILDAAETLATRDDVHEKLTVIYEGAPGVSNYSQLYAQAISQGMGEDDQNAYTKVMRAVTMKNVDGSVTQGPGAMNI